MRKFVPYDLRFGQQPWEPGRECDPTFKLDQLIAEARSRMGESRWNELNRLWELDGERNG